MHGWPGWRPVLDALLLAVPPELGEVGPFGLAEEGRHHPREEQKKKRALFYLGGVLSPMIGDHR